MWPIGHMDASALDIRAVEKMPVPLAAGKFDFFIARYLLHLGASHSSLKRFRIYYSIPSRCCLKRISIKTSEPTPFLATDGFFNQLKNREGLSRFMPKAWILIALLCFMVPFALVLNKYFLAQADGVWGDFNELILIDEGQRFFQGEFYRIQQFDGIV